LYRKAFAISSFLLLLMLTAVALSNYNREWKSYQRQYYYDVAQKKQGKLSALDKLAVETQLSTVKVVTESGRSADMCMSCHINVGNSDFSKEPLVDLGSIHPQYVLDNYPFDQYGCTACHGGKALALTTEKAHEGLRDNVYAFFEQKVADLNAPDWKTRQKAIEQLRWITGDDFGYAQSASEKDKQTAIDRILSWWVQHRDTFFVEGYGERSSPFKTENPLSKVIEADTKLSPSGKPLEYVNNNSCIACHTSMYSGRLQQASDSGGSAETLARVQAQLDHIRLWADINLSDITLSDKAFDKVAKNYTCQACHGPGEEYIKLMERGYSLMFQGRGNEASDLLKRASEIGLGNAKRNMSEPRVFKLLQALAARSSAVDTQPAAPTTESQPATKPSEPATPQTPSAEGTKPAGGKAVDTGATLIDTGMQLAKSKGCLACHSVDGSPLVGPSWKGLWGKSDTLVDGSTLVVDETYLKESVLDPNAKVVEGFSPIMPAYGFSNEEFDALIAYIKSLAE